MTTIEGLRVKALVAFREVVPLCCDNTEYSFDNPSAFQRLLCAVAQVCGLSDKLAETGFTLPWPEVDSDYGGRDDGEEV